MHTTALDPPRARNAAVTRTQILMAALKLFAEHGYSATGVREVAAEAGVSFALVRRYYGSKEGLLRVALESVLQITPLITGDRAYFGARVVDLLLQPGPNAHPLAMMMLAVADPAARVLCRDLLHERIIVPLAAWLGGPDACDRAARLHLLWTGFVAARSLLPLEEFSDRRLGDTRRWLEATTQAIADECAASLRRDRASFDADAPRSS